MAEQNQCPNGHASMGDGQCNIRGCAHCDPIVTKPTRTGDGKAQDGKAQDGKASIGGGLMSRWSTRRK